MDQANREQRAALDEFALIRHLAGRLRPSQRQPVVGIGDDAAVLPQEAKEDALITTDTMVEGVHFLHTTMGFADVGFKSVAVSVSDIAAMGGEPRFAVLSLAIPKDTPLSALEALYDGVSEVCSAYDCPLVGGDVVRTSGPFVLTSTVVGAVPKGTALLRSGARPGDVVFVTGTVGGSGAGLAHLLAEAGEAGDGRPGWVPVDEAELLRRFHQRPLPQVAAGQILRESGATSCDDISDGLASELNEIAEASGVRLRIQADRVPIAPAVRNFARRRGEDPLTYAWYGGEDYQLVGTAPPFAFARALARCESIGVRLTQIGRVEPGDGVIAQWPDGRLEQLEPRGFNHFKD